MEDRTTEHMLCTGVALERVMFKALDFMQMKPKDFKEVSPQSTIDFIGRTGLYCEF